MVCVCVCVCVCADMYDGLCLLQKKKDQGRRKDMLFLDTDSFHTHMCEHKYLVFLFEYSHSTHVKCYSVLYSGKFYSVYGLFLWQSNIFLFTVDAFQKINTIILQNFVKLTVIMKPLKLALMVWLNSQNHCREFIYVTFTKCLKWTIMSFSLCFSVFFFLK